MAATVTITKLQNDNIEIVDTAKDVCKSLDPRLDVYKRAGKVAIENHSQRPLDDWAIGQVLQVVRKDGTVVPVDGQPNELTLLYSELSAFFFLMR